MLILCYHGVSEDWPADYSIRPGRLADQVRWFLARGYRPATFTDAVTAPPSGRGLAVTFDDAYRSVSELALPLLTELGVPATVFAPTGFVGETTPRGWPGTDLWAGTPWAGEITLMDWPDLERLAEAGWEIGSHTRTHPRLPDLDTAELAEELTGSREEIERRLGGSCRSLAYPFGATDRRVARAAGAAGYAAAGGLLPGRLSARDPLRTPRISVGREWADETLFRRARPWFRELQASPIWPAIPPLVRAASRLRGVGRG
jgi:peptidoglycan/xylan/chitin deacetylase (PgdA/CDA1 family)